VGDGTEEAVGRWLDWREGIGPRPQPGDVDELETLWLLGTLRARGRADRAGRGDLD